MHFISLSVVIVKKFSIWRCPVWFPFEDVALSALMILPRPTDWTNLLKCSDMLNLRYVGSVTKALIEVNR